MLPPAVANLAYMQLSHAQKKAHLTFALRDFARECVSMNCEDDHDPCSEHLMEQAREHSLRGRLFKPSPPENP